MAIKTDNDTNGTSFHNIEFNASPRDLIDLYGQPTYLDNTGSDKINFEWEMETDDGRVFSIYDWKEYRELELDEQIDWHIGARDKATSIDAQYEIMRDFRDSKIEKIIK
jgi:hypothetical protein